MTNNYNNGTTCPTNTEDANCRLNETPPTDLQEETKTNSLPYAPNTDIPTDTSSSQTDSHKQCYTNLSEEIPTFSSDYDFSEDKILYILAKRIIQKHNEQIKQTLKPDELPQDFITQEQAAKLLGVSTRTIRFYVKKLGINRSVMGKHPLYSKKEIIEKIIIYKKK